MNTEETTTKPFEELLTVLADESIANSLRLEMVNALSTEELYGAACAVLPTLNRYFPDSAALDLLLEHPVITETLKAVIKARPVFRKWTHPSSGEIRYYVNADDFDAPAFGHLLIGIVNDHGRHYDLVEKCGLSNNSVRNYYVKAKIFFNEEGRAHCAAMRDRKILQEVVEFLSFYFGAVQSTLS